MNSFIGIKNQLAHKGLKHFYVSKQATKITSEIRLHTATNIIHNEN